jgi:tol-pal system protein YbgF
MTNCRSLKLTRSACAILACALVATPAFAVNKDMVQLQTQVQDLQEAVAHLQQSNDERMGVLRDLVQQTADSVNKMSVSVGTLQQQMRTQQEASGTKLDQVSGQVQSLNDSVDEVKARLNSLEKALQSVQNQQQSINAALQNMAPASGSAPVATPGQAMPSQPGPAPAGPDQSAPQPSMANNGKPSADVPFAPTQGPFANSQAPAAPSAAPPMPDLYNSGLKDYMAAKYPLATSEFHQVIQSYPTDPLAGNAYYYLGEIDYRAGKYAAAIKDYNHVLDQFPGNPKIPVSHLHKGMALINMKDRDGAIDEYRALIQRFPNSPEAVAARTKLKDMGARPTASQDYSPVTKPSRRPLV